MKPPADNNKEGAESHKLESESKPIWKSMSMFLVPLLLSNVLQSVGQLFGMVVVGRWLGVNDLAAISAFFPLFFLLVSFVIGIGSGSSILIGQAFGAKNEDRLKAIVGTTLTFTFIIGVVLAIIGSIFAMDIMRLMGTPENIIEI
ncbi:MATE family efflux transporter, partial [Bacillus cereus]